MTERSSGLPQFIELMAPVLLLVSVQIPAAAQARSVAAAAALNVASPMDYQVFQRQSRLRGTIELRGHAAAPADHIEVRIAGKSLLGPLPGKWKKISLDGVHDFDAKLVGVAGGYYQVDVKAMAGKRETAEVTVPHVGVGEVFLVSGQSNSTNYGEVKQATETGMVSTFSGETWRLANDPQPGVQDKSKKGSFIPAFGDAMYRKYGVPIGVASVGHGSTSVRQWLPKGEPVEVMPSHNWFVRRRSDGVLISDGTLFNGMMKRIGELDGAGREHGFRAVLWHQGESDCHMPAGNQISGATYEQMLKQVIYASRKQAGWNIPWFVAEDTYRSPAIPSCPDIEAAQRALWTSGVAFEGPNTDTLTMPYRQQNGLGIHLNDAGLKKHGQMWAEEVEKYLDKQMH